MDHQILNSVAVAVQHAAEGLNHGEIFCQCNVVGQDKTLALQPWIVPVQPHGHIQQILRVFQLIGVCGGACARKPDLRNLPRRAWDRIAILPQLPSSLHIPAVLLPSTLLLQCVGGNGNAVLVAWAAHSNVVDGNAAVGDLVVARSEILGVAVNAPRTHVALFFIRCVIGNAAAQCSVAAQS